MDSVIMTLQGLLVLLFAGSGVLKLVLPYERFTELPVQGWATEFKPLHVQSIGLAEVAAALTMAASMFVPSLPSLAGMAAVVMALVLSGAAATHLRRSEYLNIVGNLVWMSCALLVAYEALVGGG